MCARALTLALALVRNVTPHRPRDKGRSSPTRARDEQGLRPPDCPTHQDTARFSGFVTPVACRCEGADAPVALVGGAWTAKVVVRNGLGLAGR